MLLSIIYFSTVFRLFTYETPSPISFIFVPPIAIDIEEVFISIVYVPMKLFVEDTAVKESPVAKNFNI